MSWHEILNDNTWMLESFQQKMLAALVWRLLRFAKSAFSILLEISTIILLIFLCVTNELKVVEPLPPIPPVTVTGTFSDFVQSSLGDVIYYGTRPPFLYRNGPVWVLGIATEKVDALNGEIGAFTRQFTKSEDGYEIHLSWLTMKSEKETINLLNTDDETSKVSMGFHLDLDTHEEFKYTLLLRGNIRNYIFGVEEWRKTPLFNSMDSDIPYSDELWASGIITISENINRNLGKISNGFTYTYNHFPDYDATEENYEADYTRATDILMFVAFLPTIVSVLATLMSERDDGSLDYLETMGLSRSIDWTLQFVLNWARVLFASIAVHVSVAHFLLERDYEAILCVAVVHSLAVYAMIHLIAAVSTNGISASGLSVIVWSTMNVHSMLNTGIHHDNNELAHTVNPCVAVKTALRILFLKSEYEDNRELFWSIPGELGSIGRVMIALGSTAAAGFILVFYLELYSRRRSSSNTFVFLFSWTYLWTAFRKLFLRKKDPVAAQVEEAGPEAGAPMVVLSDVHTSHSLLNDGSLSGVSCDFHRNQITVIYGENGAGKSTICRIINGILVPFSGRVQVADIDVKKNPKTARKHVGYCPEEPEFSGEFTTLQHIWFFCLLKGQKFDKKRAMEYLKLLDMEGTAKKTSTQLSLGQKRKLSVIVALMSGSEVVVLDEPTAFLDSYSRQAVWDLLRKEAETKTIIVTTSSVQEARSIGNRIALVSSGKIISCGSVDFFNDKMGIVTTTKQQVSKLEKTVSQELKSKKSRSEPRSNGGSESKSATESKSTTKGQSEHGKMLSEKFCFSARFSSTPVSIFTQLLAILMKRIICTGKNPFRFIFFTIVPIVCLVVLLRTPSHFLEEREVSAPRIVKEGPESITADIFQLAKQSPDGKARIGLIGPTFGEFEKYYNDTKSRSTFIVEQISEEDVRRPNNFDFAFNGSYIWYKPEKPLAVLAAINMGDSFRAGRRITPVLKVVTKGIPREDNLGWIENLKDYEASVPQGPFMLRYTIISLAVLAHVSLAVALSVGRLAEEKAQGSLDWQKEIGIPMGIIVAVELIVEVAVLIIRVLPIPALLFYLGDDMTRTDISSFVYSLLIFIPSAILSAFFIALLFNRPGTAFAVVFSFHFASGVAGIIFAYFYAFLDYEIPHYLSTVFPSYGLFFIWTKIINNNIEESFCRNIGGEDVFILCSQDIEDPRYIEPPFLFDERGTYSEVFMMALANVLYFALLVTNLLYPLLISFLTKLSRKSKSLRCGMQSAAVRIEQTAAEVADPDQILRVDKLSKRYAGSMGPIISVLFPADTAEAVKGVSFRVANGCLGLVGANGSGKTTLVEMLANKILVSTGSAWHRLSSITTFFFSTRTHVGFNGHDGLLPFLTTKETIIFVALAKGVSLGSLCSQMNTLVDIFELKNEMGKRVGRLSSGARRRLKLALGIIGLPDILLLDNPTEAIDLSVKDNLITLLEQVKNLPDKAIVLTTHDAETATSLCDKLAFMENGLFADLIIEKENFPAAFQASNDQKRLGDAFGTTSAAPKETSTIDGQPATDTATGPLEKTNTE